MRDNLDFEPEGRRMPIKIDSVSNGAFRPVTARGADRGAEAAMRGPDAGSARGGGPGLPSPAGTLRQRMTGGLLVAVAMALGGCAAATGPDAGASEGRVCAMDVRACPDGSYVGRVGPDCDFAPCPGESRSGLEASRVFCADGTIVDIASGDADRLTLRRSGSNYQLSRTVGASGARFASEDGAVVFWNKGEEASLEIGGDLTRCHVPEASGATEETENLIRVTTPVPGATVASPLEVEGEARGVWFFEGDFPLVLTDWDGRILAEHYATAQGDWMTEDFVPFSARLAFDSPYAADDPDFMRRGYLVLRKANPADRPEHDDALEIPVVFGK